MTLVIATFAGIFAIVVGIYWVGIMRPESGVERTMRKRLRGAPGSGPAVPLEKKARSLSAVPMLDAVLRRAGRLPGALELTISRAGLTMTVGALLLAAGCLALLAWLVTYYFTSLFWLALTFGVLASCLPFVWVKTKAAKRMLKFEEQFPEAIDLISRALRAGHAFTTGLAMVAEESPQPVAAEFRTLYDEQNFGMPLPQAMRNFAARIPLLDARFFVTAVLMQRESGGNLAEILDNLARVMRERFRVKRQVRVITAHGRITGWVLSALPPCLAVAFFVISPSHMRLLIDDPLGVKMIIGAVGLQILGTLIIRKLVNIEY